MTQDDTRQLDGPLGMAFANLRALAFPHAPSEQIREMRRAFFAGADALRTIMFRRLEDTGDNNEVTDGDLALIEEIDREIRAFADRVKAGTA